MNQPIKSKYNSKKVVIDGTTFDSKNEALYYTEVIKPGIEDGSITNVIFHPKFVILPKFEREINGVHKKIGAMTYSADFQITYSNGSTKIIDIKGMMTKDFRMKYKMFHYIYDDLSIILLKAHITKKTGITWQEVKF